MIASNKVGVFRVGGRGLLESHEQRVACMLRQEGVVFHFVLGPVVDDLSNRANNALLYASLQCLADSQIFR